VTSSAVERAPVLLTWSGQSVTAETVAAQMLEMRQAASEEGLPLARASVMNLIVYTAAPSQVDFAIHTVDELAMLHPSRALVILLQPARAFSLDAEVTLRQHPLADHGLVYERTVLHAHGADPEGLDTMVIPLLIPHLQSFLWWLGDPRVGDPALRSLGAICDRLVVDSALGPAGRLEDLSLLIGGNSLGLTPPPSLLPRLVLGDVVWSRLDGFRHTLVQVFDEGQRAEFLEGVTSVEIRGHRGVRAPATPAELLFAGWLASRLGWTMPAWATGGVTMRQGNRRVILQLSGSRGARAGAGGGHPLQGLRMEAELGRRRLSLDITVSRAECHLEISETGAGTTRRTLALPQMSETEALSRELARIGRDRVYEDAMLSAARILTALES
jgi:glucose-6-phosphate dehydrogenase assembly protein OpcA